MRILCKSGRVVATRHVTWAHIPTHIPSTPQQAILEPKERENSSGGDGSGQEQVPSSAVESRPTSSADDGSGGEGHSGGDYNDGVGVDDSLDDLDSTPQEAQKLRKRCQAQLCAFNAKRANRQASVVETTFCGVSEAPSVGGGSYSSLRSSDGRGGRGGSDSANNTVGSGNESAPTRHLRKTAGRVQTAVGKMDQRHRHPRYRTLHPRQIAGRELPSRYFPRRICATWSGEKDCPS